eukprot:scaffold2012_cov228-Pinguiococcus_pyrenoidosus.AAC.3
MPQAAQNVHLRLQAVLVLLVLKHEGLHALDRDQAAVAFSAREAHGGEAALAQRDADGELLM